MRESASHRIASHRIASHRIEFRLFLELLTFQLLTREFSMNDDHILRQDLNEGFGRFIARLQRAVDHRESLEKYCKKESAVTLDFTTNGNSVVVTVKQSDPIPPVGSTILSD
ncbi:hypothetical protein [Rhodococcus sp. 27YEA15]|uniref:hypothetical protein n=1 Tax=Rhodococcus sp. 27YEA15 TaxID=3156259 RepID=UPI003C7BF192